MHRLRLLITIIALSVPATTIAAPEDRPSGDPAGSNGGPRVRPDDNRSAALLVEGLRLSSTLRALVHRLEQGNVIVYVQIEPLLKGRLAGSLTLVTTTKYFRYVRVSVSPELRGHAAIATLGHELRHALEIADEPSIVDAKTLKAFYQENGISVRTHDNGWDTEAARLVGDEVRRDLASARNSRVVESLQDFDPRQWHIVYRRARENVSTW